MAARDPGSSSAPADCANKTFLYDCEPCGGVEKLSEAKGFCTVCDELLCGDCLKVHQHSKATRKHKILHHLQKVVKNPISETKARFCEHHPESEVDFFCSDHDEVLCRLCIKVDHRNCYEVSAISDVSKGFKGSQKYMACVNDTNSLLKQFKDFKENRKKDVENIRNQGATCENEIKKLRGEMSRFFDKMEYDLKRNLSDIVEKELLYLNDNMTNIGSAINSLETRMKHLTDANSRGLDQDVFICMKKVATQKMKAVLADAKKDAYHFDIKFEADKDLLKLLDGVQCLGRFKVGATNAGIGGVDLTGDKNPKDLSTQNQKTKKSTVEQPRKTLGAVAKQHNLVAADTKDRHIQKVKQAKLRGKGDDSECRIRGCDVMPSGEFVLCDWANKKVKVTDITVTLTASIKLQSRPCDVAATNNSEVLVSLPDVRQLQFVTVKNRMKLGPIIEIGRECFGLAVCRDSIVVTCKDKIGGDVLMLDLTGGLQKRFRLCENDCLAGYLSHNIAVGKNGDTLYVSHHSTDSVTCVKTDDGRDVKTYKKELSGPQGMLVDTADNLYVCNWESCTVQIVGKDGNILKTLLSPADGIMNPECIGYRASDRTLVVGRASGDVNVYRFT